MIDMLAKWYLETNVLLTVAWISFGVGQRLARRFNASEKATLHLGRVTLLAALAASAFVAILPAPRAYDVTAGLFDKPLQAPSATGPAPTLATFPTLPSHQVVDEWHVSAKHVVGTLLVIAFFYHLARLTLSWLTIRRLMKRTYAWRRIGRLGLSLSHEVTVPFSFRGLWRAHIVIPQSMASSPDDLRIALRHEGQHHRHGDTTWLIGLELLTLAMPLNPFAGLWRRTLAQLHEFACDEALIGRGRLTPHAYGSCLIRVTEAALAGGSLLVGTASMAAEGMGPGHTQRLLERRIVMLKRYSARPSRPRKLAALLLGLALPAFTFSAAYAAKGVKPRDALTRDEVVKLVEAMDVSPGFPLVVSDAVVERLNKIVTDPDRSQSTREALDRMAQHKTLLTGALQKYGHPAELLAIPLVESAYNNLPESKHKSPPGHPLRSAGLWQFVKQTARNFGLVVNKATDQRLDVPLATDAAMRYLGANKLRFNDWLLAVAAYNQGEGAVQAAIAKAGTRDPWRLVETKHLNDYLVLITAGAILIGNPQLVE